MRVSWLSSRFASFEIFSSERHSFEYTACDFSSKLEVRLVNRINKLEKSTGYFLAALMEANVDGKWIPYNDLDEESLVKLDIDLYNSITALLRNI